MTAFEEHNRARSNVPGLKTWRLACVCVSVSLYRIHSRANKRSENGGFCWPVRQARA